VEIIEQLDNWRKRYRAWKSGSQPNDRLDGYPFVSNSRAPFTPARRSLPMMNIALISSAGAYIEGTEPFDTNAPDGDFSFREIPTEVGAGDLSFAARGYDQARVQQDINVQIPLARLHEYEANRVIGQLNSAFWSLCGFIPDASMLVTATVPKLIERLKHYEVQAALLIPASRLCHQSLALVARGVEQAGIPTIVLSVDRELTESVRPPRAGFYKGELGCVAGQPNWPQHQRRILDEALRWLEPMGEPGIRKLVVELESQVEAARGER
jgi:D-proline reductase (dithiol) PrdB